MVASDKPEFKGSGVLLIRNVLLYVLVSAPLMAFCLMGAKSLHIFVGMIIMAVPFVLVVGLLVSRFDTFSFDDAQQRIAKPFGRPIPYESVMRIDMNETSGLLQVRIKQGMLRGSPLIYALPSKDKVLLKEELLKRFPQSVLQERPYADWKSLTLVVTVIVLLTAGFHLYLYRSNSQIGVLPQKVVWAQAELPAKRSQQHAIGSFQVVLPPRYHVIASDKDALLVEDAKSRTEIKFVSALHQEFPAPKSDFIKYLTGIGDYFDVLETAYSARIGVIPLVLKDVMLLGLSDVTILDIREAAITSRTDERLKGTGGAAPAMPPALKGFATQGKKKGKELTSILLTTDIDRKAEIYIFVSGPVRVDEKMLETIVAGVRLFPR